MLLIHNSKEEKFFDTYPWLESDSEDFFSVNGDITPHANTPSHPGSFREALPLGKSFSMDRTQGSLVENSSTDKMKKLADLFCESFGRDEVDTHRSIQNTNSFMANGGLDSKLSLNHEHEGSNVLIVNPICNSRQRTPINNLSTKKESTRTGQCCFPNLARSLSCNDQRKKRISMANVSTLEAHKDLVALLNGWIRSLELVNVVQIFQILPFPRNGS
ncbi:hypothetical protein RJ641_012896 [Dillenia turbinata]|uniref:Uncharacterized protein n=1 Tax=Dillenia turbinata TaxID=194707 RepID=A0AAN8UX51_9MAGN